MTKHTFLIKLSYDLAAVSAVNFLLNLLTSQLGQFSQQLAAVNVVDFLSAYVL